MIQSNEIPVPFDPIEDEFLPKYKTEGAVCADLYAYIPDEKSIEFKLGDIYRISTGLRVEIPKGFKLCFSLRSGMTEHGLCILNAPAQIDDDFRGIMEISLAKLAGHGTTIISHGDRIAQCWLENVYKMKPYINRNLSETERGNGGFGSTGVK